MFLYKTSFENIVTASVNFDKNILLSQASLEPLKSIIPATVNLDKNVDLVGAAFNAAVVNRFNKNGDGIDTNTAIAFKKYFIHKPTNIEHKKQRVVGHIVNSAFSSYGENKILSDTNPAADVQGVVIDDGTSAMKTENEEDEEDNEEEDNEENEMEVEEAECYEINSIDLLSLNNKLFSQSDKQPVNNTKTKIMDLEQILSALKTVLAEKQETVKFSEEAVASISAKIADSIKQKNEEIKLEMEKAEVAKAEAIAQAEQFKKDLEDNNKKLAETAAKLQELQNTISAQAAQEIYNSRMASLDNEYDLDEVDRSYLAKEISALATTDEAFASYKEKLAVIFRHKNKASKLDQDKIFQDRLEAELAKRMGQVKTQPTEVVEKTVEVETALANAKREEPTIPSQTNTPTVTKTSWKERLGKAFSKENITVKF